MVSKFNPDDTLSRRDVAIEGEHPDAIVADIAARPKPSARIIVVANEKGGVGKSTIAFHLCVALADSGLKVAVIDLDRRQQTLARALTSRAASARRLGVTLPLPKQQVLKVQSGAMLCQEICRVGWESDVVVVDVAGYDSGIARRAIALADTLVTPVNNSFVDLDLLGRFHPVTLELLGPGCFAIAVNELRDARIRRGLPRLDWVVMQNRVRQGVSQNQDRIEAALESLAPQVGFRLGKGLGERVAYRELFLLGLTHLDMRRIPGLARAKSDANREILALVADLAVLAGRAVEPKAAEATARTDAVTEPAHRTVAHDGS
jgi:chromosome partitioning protein